jgi:hypothetical protein
LGAITVTVEADGLLQRDGATTTRPSTSTSTASASHCCPTPACSAHPDRPGGARTGKPDGDRLREGQTEADWASLGKQFPGMTLTLFTDDIDATVAQLTERGVDLLKPVRRAPWGIQTAGRPLRQRLRHPATKRGARSRCGGVPGRTVRLDQNDAIRCANGGGP